jgi:hypothetical protein
VLLDAPSFHTLMGRCRHHGLAFLDHMLPPSTRISVVLSTFNQPTWLEKVLWGYSCQSDENLELIVADDGSDHETADVIGRMREESGMSIRHVWHPHEGFRKSVILNKATLETTGDYLVFSDGDCIPRRDFVATHRTHARQGIYLSGGYTKLPLALSRQISKEDILSGVAFDPAWLAERGLPCKPWHKHAAGKFAGFWNGITPTRASWNGHGSSGWKSDILRVNGHNEEMRYGGQDRELGERLENAGVRGRSIRYFAIVLHLDHPRGYATPESIAKNKAIRADTVRNKTIWTPAGIRKESSSPT